MKAGSSGLSAEGTFGSPQMKQFPVTCHFPGVKLRDAYVGVPALALSRAYFREDLPRVAPQANLGSGCFACTSSEEPSLKSTSTPPFPSCHSAPGFIWWARGTHGNKRAKQNPCTLLSVSPCHRRPVADAHMSTGLCAVPLLLLFVLAHTFVWVHLTFVPASNSRRLL